MSHSSSHFNHGHAKHAWARLSHEEQQSIVGLTGDSFLAVTALINQIIGALPEGSAPEFEPPATSSGHPLLADLAEALDAAVFDEDRVAAAAEAINVATSLLPDLAGFEWEHHDLVVIMKSLASKAAF